MSDEAAKWKSDAAREALGDVRDGMLLGLGTGSTAEAFVRLLADRITEGLRIGGGVPTSERTASLCRQLGVPLLTLDEAPRLDLTVDGADEADEALNLVKGGGGALLREKIVAAASERMIVIADRGKLVETLGRFPLPIEVNGFGLTATALAIRKVAEKLSLPETIRLRITDGEPFVTDGGHLILDASFERIADPERLSAALHAVPGVVEHGLFVGLASTLILAGPQGVRRVDRP